MAGKKKKSATKTPSSDEKDVKKSITKSSRQKRSGWSMLEEKEEEDPAQDATMISGATGSGVSGKEKEKEKEKEVGNSSSSSSSSGGIPPPEQSQASQATQEDAPTNPGRKFLDQLMGKKAAAESSSQQAGKGVSSGARPRPPKRVDVDHANMSEVLSRLTIAEEAIQLHAKAIVITSQEVAKLRSVGAVTCSIMRDWKPIFMEMNEEWVKAIPPDRLAHPMGQRPNLFLKLLLTLIKDKVEKFTKTQLQRIMLSSPRLRDYVKEDEEEGFRQGMMDEIDFYLKQDPSMMIGICAPKFKMMPKEDQNYIWEIFFQTTLLGCKLKEFFLDQFEELWIQLDLFEMEADQRRGMQPLMRAVASGVNDWNGGKGKGKNKGKKGEGKGKGKNKVKEESGNMDEDDEVEEGGGIKRART